MKGGRISVILNPTAGAGKGKRIWAKVKPELDAMPGCTYVLSETQHPGHAIQLAGLARINDHSLVLIVGGDGTINEVVNGLLDQVPMIAGPVDIGIINCGSGGGFAQSLGLPSSLSEQVRLAVYGKVRVVDAGYVECLSETGRKVKRFFINECQSGISGEIVSKIGAGKKQWGGTIAFGLQTLKDLLSYRATRIKLCVDGRKEDQRDMIGVVVGNGTHCAGGMQLTPGAVLDDAMLDILTIEEMPLWERLSVFSKIYSGSHIHSPRCDLEKCRSLKIETEKPLLVETDGELIGQTPATMRVVPDSIRVRC